ncbi:MAG TPA: hypothetical protein PKZ67_10515 [Accumulibacter sp.]|nr:hypothetical protein [Accumulibacter sp.]
MSKAANVGLTGDSSGLLSTCSGNVSSSDPIRRSISSISVVSLISCPRCLDALTRLGKVDDLRVTLGNIAPLVAALGSDSALLHLHHVRAKMHGRQTLKFGGLLGVASLDGGGPLCL